MRYLLRSLLLIFLSVSVGMAQTTAPPVCPPNIDFELGNLSNWEFSIGSCCPIGTTVTSTPVAGRHTLTSGSGTDMYGGFPIVAPGGGSYSLKLGNNSTGAQAEKARYYINVPAGVSNYSLIYRYAVVFQDPGHPASQQPRFEVKAYNTLTNAPIACAQHTYVAASSLPGFTKSTINTSVWYKAWTTASIDLSGLGGQTIAVDFASGDCSQGGHFGYGYVDMSCGLFQIQTVACSGSPTSTLSAPPGFFGYTWMDATYSTVVGTGPTITVPTPSATTQYNVILAPYAGFGCGDTLSTTISVYNVGVDVSNDTTICQGVSIQLQATGHTTGTPSAFTYSWAPATGLSCVNCPNPTVTPGANTTYVVTATDQNGCGSTDSVQVSVTPKPAPPAVTSPVFYCKNDTPAALVATGSNLLWYTAAMGGSGVAAAPVPATGVPGTTTRYVSQTVAACESNRAPVTITVHPLPVVGITPANPVQCLGETDTLTASGGVSYSWSPALGLSATGGATVFASPLETTSYAVTVTDANNCINNATVTVTVDTLPIVQIAPASVIICDGDTASLSATGAHTYVWTPVGGTGSISGSSIQATPSVTTVYNVTGTNLKGCTGTQSGTVTVHPMPVVTAISNSPVCAGTPLQLSAVSTVSGSTFQWSGPAAFSAAIADPVISAPVTAQSGYYLVTASANGCTSVPDTMQVVVNPVYAAAIYDTVCQGDTVLFAGNSYHTAGSYTLVFPTVAGCDSVATLHLTVHPNPEFTILPATAQICPGDSIALTATGAYSFSWGPADGLGSGSGSTVMASPAGPATYSVTATSSHGCQTIETKSVSILPTADSVQEIITCRNELPFVWNGVTIAADAASSANAAVFTTTAANSCDSVVTLSLLIKDTIATTVYRTFCSDELPASWNGIPIPAGSATHPVFATWTGTAANGCDSVVKLNLTVNPLPVLTISPADTAFCAGQSATLTAHGAQLYHWSPAAALDVDTGAVVQTTPSATTAYTLTGTDVNGCTNTASARVTIFQAYPKTVVPVTVCSDSVFIFNEQPFIPAGDYTIRMTAQNGCDSLILLQLRRKEAPVAAFAIPEHVCVNQPLPVVASHVSVPAEYAWDFDGAQIQYGQSAGPYGVIWTTPGTRRVTFTISSPPCPPVAVAHDIEVMPLPLADIYMAQEGTICIGDKIALQTTYEPRYRYQWLPAGFFEDPHSDRATAVLRACGYITLQVTDPYGCVAADSVYVAGEPCCTVTMPNAFSPNSDGRNDYFRPITRGHQQIAAFRVMNRWGQTVFETLQQDKGWDGTLGGVPQEVGTYMYFLRYRCADGEFYEKKGEVILLR